VIGVIPRPDQLPVVQEFFELFKTPWEIAQGGRSYDVVIATIDEPPPVDARLLLIFGAEPKSTDASLGIVRGEVHNSGGWLPDPETAIPLYGSCAMLAKPDAMHSSGAESIWLRFESANGRVIRAGYDLFDEVRHLLETGQPVEQARIPALDLHIARLRRAIVDEGIPLLEIPPVPSGHSHAVCLTHDIDFVAIRDHRFDHTMWGFLLRATVGAARNWVKGRFSVRRLLDSWRAAVSLPLVHLGLVDDFWRPFKWYLEVEKGLGGTYFLIPFKRRAGEHVKGPHAARRATAYDVTDIADSVRTLREAGCEIGVHGIDAWHTSAKGREESERVAAVSGLPSTAIRMHWLLRDEHTPNVLEAAGYSYDSTVGYNETIGYRAGTGQVFRPLGTRTLLELPMHIQDGALFFPRQLNLSEEEAARACDALIANARRFGGVLTLLWHDRSHAPERFWGDFYVRLIERLRSSDAWFGTGSEIVEWFQKRREVRFDAGAVIAKDSFGVGYEGGEIDPPLTLRIHHASSSYSDVPWNGKSTVDLERLQAPAAALQLGNRASTEVYSLS
jgi:hypothetical protein